MYFLHIHMGTKFMKKKIISLNLSFLAHFKNHNRIIIESAIIIVQNHNSPANVPLIFHVAEDNHLPICSLSFEYKIICFWTTCNGFLKNK